MELPTYTSIWRIEKRLYKLYDFRLPAPLPIGQIAVFAAVTVPYIVLLTLLGLPFNHNLFWLYVLPPGLLTWLATRPVLESKRLPELLISQARYLGEPSTWCRMAPLAEKDQIVMFGRVWLQVSVAERDHATGELPAHAQPALPAAAQVRPVQARPVPVPSAAAADTVSARPAGGPGRLVRERQVSGRAAPGRAAAMAPHAERARETGAPQEARWPYIAGPRPRPVPGPAGAPGSAVAPGPAVAGTPGAGAGWGRDAGAGTRRDPGLAGPHSAGRHAGPARPPATVGHASAAGVPSADAAGTRLDRPFRNAGTSEGAGTGWPMVGYAPAASLQPGGRVSGPGRHSRPHPAEGAVAAGDRAVGAGPESGPGETVSRSGSAGQPAGTGPAAGTGWPVGYPSAATVPPGSPSAASGPAAAQPCAGWPYTAEDSGLGDPGPQQSAPEASVPVPSWPEASVPGVSAPQASAPLRPAPVVIVPAWRPLAGTSRAAAPARQRPAPGVERALNGPGGRPSGWRRHGTVVPGGHGPGRRDHIKQARVRAALPLGQPRLVVVLGCTVGAGQTVTTLMLADLLAGLRGEPVAAVDLNPGPASLTGLANAPAITVGALLAARASGAHAAHAQRRGPAPARGFRTKGRLDVICQDAAPEGGTALPDIQHDRLVSVLASRYPLALVDPGAPAVAKLLAGAGQLVLVAPASPDAGRAVSKTCEWLGGHGHGALATRSITVLNGVDQRSVRHAEQAELVLRGRCRAIVRVPWDDHLAELETGIRDSPEAADGRPRLARLRPAMLQAYTTLAGVLVTSLADPVRRRAAR